MQFFEGDRVQDRHVLEGRVPEDDPRLEVQFLGQVLAQALQHRKQGRVTAAALYRAASGGRLVLILIVRPALALESVASDKPDFVRVLEEFLALWRHVDESVGLDLLLKQVHHEALMDDRAPETGVVRLAGPEERQSVVAVGLDHGVGLAGQNGRQMVGLEMLRQGFDKFDDQSHLLAPVEGRFRVHAVVAHPAVVDEVVLSEIVQQHPSAAHVRLGVGHGVHQELPPDLLFGDWLALHELLKFADVFVAVVGDAFGVLSVTAGPAGLLVVALDALRYVVVDHEPHVRLVDAHSEGDRRHDDVHVLHQEAVLVLGPGLGVESGVVGQSLDPVDLQQVRHLLDLLAAEAVDDAGLARMLFDVADDVLVGIHLLPHLVVEVGPVERRLEDRRVKDA